MELVGFDSGLANSGLGQKVFKESLEYGAGAPRTTGAPGKSKRALSSSEGVESIRVAQKCIKQALSMLSPGAPPADKENSTPSKTPSKNRPSSSISTPVKAKLSKTKTAECSNMLCSAVHVLRCVIGQNPSLAQAYESAMGNAPLALEKICYHTLVACVDLISSLHQQNVCGTPTTPQSSSASSETAVAVVKACQVAMSTYEMLGILVRNYVESSDPSSQKDPNIITVPSLSGDTSAPHSHFTFAVPALPSESFTTGSGEFDKQLCKIVAGASINAARCASELSLLSSMPSSPFNFGQKFERELKILSRDPFAGSTILYSVALTYIQVMAKQGQLREAASYKERSHKFLWSFASRYDKFISRRSSRSTPNKNLLLTCEKMCLELRRRSVLVLLGNPLETSSLPQPVASHVEASCSASTRAVGNYIQRCSSVSTSHCSSPSSALPLFNETIGKLIDTSVGKMSKAAPPSYAEYCAWRIVSTTPSPTSDLPFLSNVKRLDHSGYAAVRLLCTIKSITSPSSAFDADVSFAGVSNDVDSLRSLCSKADGKTNARNYRILSASKLSGFASNAISNPESTDPGTKYVAGYLLKQIFAPLSKFTSSLAPQMDCLLKSAALFDLCAAKSPPAGAPNALELAQQCMNTAFATISTPGKLDTATVLNCGKGFAAIGRKRFESKNYIHSVLPILMSLHCFEKNPSSQQLHLRYAMLGSSLKQCNKFQHAAVAYGIAVKSAICSDRTEQELDSLVAASLYASGDVEAGATGAIVTNLINCVISSEGDSEPKQLPPSTEKILDGSTVGAVFNAACSTETLSIAKIFRAAMSHGTSAYTSHYAFNLSSCNVLRQLGRMMSSSNSGLPNSVLARHVAEVYDAANSGDVLLQCNAQLVYARSMMVPFKQEFKKLKALFKLSRDATSKLKDLDQRKYSPLFVAASLILNAELGMNIKDEKNKFVSYLNDALEICKENVSSCSRSSLSTVLANLQNFFTFLRDTVRSSQCAGLLSKCGSEPKRGVLEFISNAYLHAGMNDLAANIDTNGDIGEIVLKFRGESIETLGDYIKELYGMLDRAEDECIRDGDESQQWKVVLVCAALSEAEEKRANPAEALFYTRKAIIVCKTAIRGGGGRKWMGALVESLTNMGKLWGLLGDKRRAEGYLVAAGECLGLPMGGKDDIEVIDLEEGEGEEEDGDTLSSFNYEVVRERAGSTSNELLVEHVSKKMRLLAMPPEMTVDVAKKELKVDLVKEVKEMDIERNIEVVLGLLSQGDALRRVCEGFDNGFVSKYSSAKEILNTLLDDDLGRLVERAIATVGVLGAEAGRHAVGRLGDLKGQVNVRIARAMEIVDGWGEDVEKIYQAVRKDENAHGRERSVACYRLGRAILRRGRGELRSLWSGDKVDEEGDIGRARELFLEASKTCGPGTSSLGRKIYRCLGLVAGPRGDFGEGSSLGGFAAVYNLHKSLGASVRMNVWYNLGGEDRDGGEDCDEEVRRLFGILDDQELGLKEGARELELVVKKYLPEDWNVVNVAVCPSGEILVGSMRKDGDNVVGAVGCVFEDDAENERRGGGFLMQSFDTLDLLLEKSRRQLDGIDPAMAKKFGEKEKREWWRQRQDIDNGLKKLMEDVQVGLVEASKLKGLFLVGHGAAEVEVEEGGAGVADDLSKKFEAACVIDLTNDDEDEEVVGEELETLTEKDIKKMTVAVLKENILERDEGASLKGLKKAGLQSLLLEIVERRRIKGGVKSCEVKNGALKSSAMENSESRGNDDKKTTIILTLDERLQRLPWESMPMLEKLFVCRVPSLPFVLSSLIEKRGQMTKIRKKNCFYILDPEGNLPTTKKTLNPVLESYAGQKGWGWKGYVGRIPDITVLERLEREDGLMIYCGHGGAECCFPRVEVEERLMNKKRGCKSSVFLFGCSSGRLSSGGGAKRGVGAVFKQMEYEPDGVATSYLGAGAPCVLGNLWDVSDRDIDRFCIEFMDKFFTGGKNVAQCVSESRGVCKMRYVVGAAVVVYGVPIVFEG